MAELAGYGGNMKYDPTAGSSASTALGGVNNWTVNYAGDALETTDFADSGKRTYIAGLTGWTGNATGNYSASVSYSSIAPGDTVSLKFMMNSSHHLTGSAVVTGLNFGVGVDGVATINWDFQGTAGLTIT